MPRAVGNEDPSVLDLSAIFNSETLTPQMIYAIMCVRKPVYANNVQDYIRLSPDKLGSVCVSLLCMQGRES